MLWISIFHSYKIMNVSSKTLTEKQQHQNITVIQHLLLTHYITRKGLINKK